MKLPEPRKIEIEIFGQKAFLQERTAQERYHVECAFSDRNGDTSLDYILPLRALECALACNLKPGFWNWRKNRRFRYNHLKKNLVSSQIEFLLEEIGRLEYGDEYDALKKKIQAEAVKKLTETPSGDSLATGSD